VETSAITQLFGEGGSGKTNICLQLARNVVNSGQKVVYIDTEGVSMERFAQICGEESDTERVGKEVLFFQVMSSKQLQEAINNTVKLVSKDLHIGLVIVDSATVFYRLNLGTKRWEENRRELAKVVLDLMGIARKQDIPILITTQVYGGLGEGEVGAIGGYTLAHNCKAILRLEKLDEGGKRRATVVKHRSLPSGRSADFLITGCGVEEVPELDDEMF